MSLKYLAVILLVIKSTNSDDFSLHDRAGVHYKVYHQPMTWQDARTVCARSGGSIAMPRTENEVDALVDLILSKPCSGASAVEKIWLGFHDIFEENNYVSLHGEHIHNFFGKWGPSQPDNVGEEDCGSLDVVNRNLYDHKCQLKLSFVCQKAERGQNEVPCEPSMKGYTCSEELGKCYKYNVVERTWVVAMEKCVSEGGHLAIVRSKREQEFMLNMTVNKPKYIKNIHHTWLGFHDQYKEGQFVTVKDEELDQVGYVDWFRVSPNGRATENCGAFFSGQLDDGPCVTNAPFFCEISVLNYGIAF